MPPTALITNAESVQVYNNVLRVLLCQRSITAGSTKIEHRQPDLVNVAFALSKVTFGRYETSSLWSYIQATAHRLIVNPVLTAGFTRP